VTQTAEATQSERKGCEQEWDVLLINSGELVAVEVKSRLRDGHLERMEEKLAAFEKAFPQYANYGVYGAVAALKYNAHLDKVAEQRGLFVFQPSREVNKKGFRPKAYLFPSFCEKFLDSCGSWHDIRLDSSCSREKIS
jgi:type I restriction-modification system DNA methylase subunit